MSDSQANSISSEPLVPFTLSTAHGHEEVVHPGRLASFLRGRHVTVSGKRKSGKTSLLKALARDAEASGKKVCWIDLEANIDPNLVKSQVSEWLEENASGVFFFDGIHSLFPNEKQLILSLVKDLAKTSPQTEIYVTLTGPSGNGDLPGFEWYYIEDWSLEQATQYLYQLEERYGEEVGEAIAGMLAEAPEQLEEYYSRPYFLEKVYLAVADYRDFEDPAYLFRIGKEIDFAILEEVKRPLVDKPVMIVSGANTEYEINKPVVTAGEKDLVITPYYPGLGDLLMLSHIPRIAKESGKYERVLVTLSGTYRDDLYQYFIWETNPFVDGYCHEQNPGCGRIEEQATDLSMAESKRLNFLDAMMLGYGLDDKRRFHEPELYYQAEAIPGLQNAVVYDPNFMTDSRIDQTDFFLVEQYFLENGLSPDFQLSIMSDIKGKEGYRSIPVTHFGEFLKASSFQDYCNIIYSAREVYCLTTGTATLAAAMGKQANVLLGQDTTWCHHSRINRYIDLRPCGSMVNRS
ncbi:hypothetical protein AB9P05_21250 [Roseivirga sp. BDSF3-8]|uniref:hypothetical protein n=1 Tax=Roseivirga sp. BDSF3-8 TaxID=3241598 RepID=UPI0035319930